MTGPLGDRSRPSGRCSATAPRSWRWPGRAATPSSTRAPRDPLGASTRGTGELIAAAIRAGATRVIVGVGGSATTDGGLAAVQALDWSFGRCPGDGGLRRATAFLDAAVVYGPQKGASHAQVGLLTRRLEQLAGVYRDRTGVDVTDVGGARAPPVGSRAGWRRSARRLEPGLRRRGRPRRPGGRARPGADLVVTGEGKLDRTSFAGKVVGGVLEVAARRRRRPRRASSRVR